MRQVKSFIKCQTIIYDFDKDGGAVGQIPTNVTIPSTAFIFLITANQTTQIQGGAGAQFLLGIATFAGLYQNYVLPFALTNTVQKAVLGRDFPVVMEIINNPVTQGRAVFTFHYNEMKF